MGKMTNAFKIISIVNLIFMLCIYLSKYFLMFEYEINYFYMIGALIPIILYLYTIFVLVASNQTKSNSRELISGMLLYVIYVVVVLRSLLDSSLVIADLYYPVLLNYYSNILVIPTSIYALYICYVYHEKGKIKYVKKLKKAK